LIQAKLALAGAACGAAAAELVLTLRPLALDKPETLEAYCETHRLAAKPA
jgi:hypothetical protein